MPFKCPRCHSESGSYSCSWFNTQNICLDCSRQEEQHPDYRFARDKEHEAVLAGDLNFKGVGWPGAQGRIRR
jgi:hypothetical protein